MRTADRILLLLICCFLGILAARALVGYPVKAARQETINVNLYSIGGRTVFKDEFIKR